MDKYKNKVDTVNRPDQRVSLKTKQTPKWYIQNANYYINLALNQTDKTITKKYLDAANGLVDTETYKYVLKNYVEKLGETGKQYGEIRDVDFLTPIKERYMGEFINMFSNYQVFNNDPTIVLARNKALADKIMGWINQQCINELNKKGFPTNQQSVEQETLEITIDKFLEEWKDSVVIDSQNRLDLFNSINNCKRKYQEAYYYWLACEECYTYREINHGEVNMITINPMEYYRVDIGERYVEDDPAGLRVYKISIYEVIDKFRDKLSKEQFEYIKDVMARGVNITPQEGMILLNRMTDFNERKEILNRENLIYKGFIDKDYECEVYHYVFKTEVEQFKLLHYDALGNILESIVDDTYKLNKEMGDISIESEWILQVYEGYRFGNAGDGVYLKPEPIAVQRENINNNSICKLPYNGIVGLINGNIRNPIFYRILPYLALYRIYTLQEERAIAKFKSWLLLPESILADSSDMSTEQRFASAKIDSVFPFDDADMNPGALQAIKEISTQAVIQYINVLRELKLSIKQDAWELANMNGARFGDTKDYAGKAITEYNYAQALTGSVWSLESFNSFKEIDDVANIDYTKVAWIDGKQGSYIDPNTNQLVIVNINGSSDFSSNIGVNIQNNSDVQRALQTIRTIAFSAGQNGDFDVALEAVDKNNITVIKRNINKAIEAKRQFDLEINRINEEARAQTEQIISDRELAKQQFESQENQANRDKDILINRERNETEERIWDKRLQVDTNGNGNIDKQEAAIIQNGYTQADLNSIKIQKALQN